MKARPTKRKFSMVQTQPAAANIKVLGVGGGGSNAVRYMASQGVEQVQYYCVNTDLQHLASLSIDGHRCLQIGMNTTRGLGAGSDPEKGRQAALESRQQLRGLMKDANMLFLTAGMGGGTGTGAAPVIAQLAQEMGVLTVAVVTKPFLHENRMQAANEGVAVLSRHVDSIIVVPNSELLAVLGKNTSLREAFADANDVLYRAVLGIADLVIRPGHVNVDFADVQSVMKETGRAIIGTGIASGTDRAQQAVERAINNPLVEKMRFNSAKGLLVNISANVNLSVGEYASISNLVRENCAEKDTNIVIGTVIDPKLGNDLKVTLVATGIRHHQLDKADFRAVEAAGQDQAPQPPPVVRSGLEAPAAAVRQPANTPQPHWLQIGSFINRLNKSASDYSTG